MTKLKFLVKPLLIFLALAAITFPVVKSIMRPGYFPIHDDIQSLRVMQLDECVKDGQIPCRWVPDMGYGYGYPQFNYYGPLPYYVMEGFHLTGLGYIDSVKAGLVLFAFISVLGMFLLGKSLWGQTGGFVSSIVYSFAPYRALDFYVRGDISELVALAIFPFIFWSIYEVLKGNKKHVLWLALPVGALLSSHNISTLIFSPIAVFWAAFVIATNKSEILPKIKERVSWLIMAGIWGLSLGAFFVIPAWFEKGYVHVETILMGYFNYLAHFVSLGQTLTSTYWNYGSSNAGPWDELFLGVGLLHWVLPLLSLGLLFVLRKTKEFKISAFLIIVGWVALFLTHEKSSFIWNNLQMLEYLQFPWRFLIIATFMFSVASGSIAKLFSGSKQLTTLVLMVFVMSMFLYSGYFKPQRWINISDSEKFSGNNWMLQQTISIFDYLPIYAKHPPAERAPEQPLFLTGKGKVLNGYKRSATQYWNIEIVDGPSKVELPLYYFPGWEVRVSTKVSEIDYNNELGLITVNVPEGVHTVVVNLMNTPIRDISNLMTILGFIAIPFGIYKLWKK